MKIRCIVVDDEPLARNLIEGYVNQTPFLELAASFSNAIDAFERIKQGDISLVFLDIQMPQLSGMELSRLLNDRCRIIFITAFDRYAIEGYKVDAIDYLLKPVSYSDFLAAATKAQKRFTGTTVEPQESIVVWSEYKQIIIKLNNILYIESDKDYIHIYQETGSPVMTLMSMKSIMGILPAESFVRVHKSFIVNIGKIKTIERGQIIFDKVRIPVSETYKENFLAIFRSKNILDY